MNIIRCPPSWKQWRLKHLMKNVATTCAAFKSPLVVNHVWGSVVIVNCFTFWNLARICEESWQIIVVNCFTFVKPCKDLWGKLEDICLGMFGVLYANGGRQWTHCLVNDFFRVISYASLLLWARASLWEKCDFLSLWWQFFLSFWTDSANCGMLVYANGST